MNKAEQAAVLLGIAVQLRKHGSWAGETHIQKAAFLLQALLGVPTGFEFVLYKHGPFSFDLRELLNQMEAEHRIALEDQPYPYGPKIVEGSTASILRQRSKLYDRKIVFIAEQLGNSSVSMLERIATALFVTLDSGVSRERRVQRLTELKPHVQSSDASAAFERLHQIKSKASQEGLDL